MGCFVVAPNKTLATSSLLAGGKKRFLSKEQIGFETVICAHMGLHQVSCARATVQALVTMPSSLNRWHMTLFTVCLFNL